MLLMHKDVIVADIKISAGNILVREIYKKEHMPIGTFHENSTILDAQIRSWQSHRTIPYNREDISNIAKRLDCSFQEAAILGQMVSLTDCFWIRPENSTVTWNDINFYNNPFSGTFAHLYFSDSGKGKISDFHIPDFTTDGVVPKVWIISNGIPYLLKFGGVRSANEIVATKVAEMMNIPHVSYSFVNCGEKKGCICPCFVNDSNTDCVSGLQLRHEYSLSKKSLYNYLTKLGFKQDVDRMIALDELLHNTDRHENNFSIMYNADNLKPIRFSPLFDSGSCLNWDNSTTLDMRPFSSEREEQFRLADPIPFPPQKDVVDIIKEAYCMFNISKEQLQIALNDLKNTYDEREKDLEILSERE